MASNVQDSRSRTSFERHVDGAFGLDRRSLRSQRSSGTLNNARPQSNPPQSRGVANVGPSTMTNRPVTHAQLVPGEKGYRTQQLRNSWSSLKPHLKGMTRAALRGAAGPGAAFFWTCIRHPHRAHSKPTIAMIRLPQCSSRCDLILDMYRLRLCMPSLR